MNLVAPSILNVSNSMIGDVIHKLEEGKADWIHIDVIDWKRTPDKRDYDIQLLKALKGKKFYDAHLMVDDIKGYISRYSILADSITLHSKSIEFIKLVKSLGKKVGIAINPDETIESYLDILKHVNLVLFMSVYPGYGGQKFIEETIKKIEAARKFRQQQNLCFAIQVDGGINQKSYTLIKGKIDIVVAGSYIINSQDVGKAIQSLRD